MRPKAAAAPSIGLDHRSPRPTIFVRQADISVLWRPAAPPRIPFRSARAVREDRRLRGLAGFVAPAPGPRKKTELKILKQPLHPRWRRTHRRVTANAAWSNPKPRVSSAEKPSRFRDHRSLEGISTRSVPFIFARNIGAPLIFINRKLPLRQRRNTVFFRLTF